MNIKLNFIKNDSNYFEEPLYLKRSNPLINAVAAHKIPDIAILDQKYNLLDLNVVKLHLINEGKLSNLQITKILNDSKKILREEPNLIEINSKTHVIGDIHGQFYDLINIFKYFDLKKDKLLFLGDYVDRGYFSTECYLFLLLLKCHFPKNIFLLRGNHESERMTSYFTFKSECINKYDENIYKEFVESFKNLPICALIQKSAFCAHGGISKDLICDFNTFVKKINKINRFIEVPFNGIFCDLLWSDPLEAENEPGRSFLFNSKRNCSFFYNKKDVKNFLSEKNFKVIIRGHEVKEKGYELQNTLNEHYSVCTVFSAPNYCDVYKNKAGIIEYDNEIKAIKILEAVEHPYCLPNYMDAINWSFPFICEKLIDFFIDLSENLNTIEKDQEQTEEIEVNEKILKNIVLLRTERECIDEFFDEESTLDCCNINVTEIENLSYNDALNYDKENEEIKNSSDLKNSDLSIYVSPSLKPKSLKKIEENEINLKNLKIEKDENIEKFIENKEKSVKNKENIKKKAKKENKTCKNIFGIKLFC